MSIAVHAEVRLDRRLRELGAAIPRDFLPDLLDDLGAAAASQTQRRISEEKTAPDGAPWEPWSKRYAKTRHSGQGLLESQGDLFDSIQHAVEGDEVLVGSNLVYAATHQLGDQGTDRRGRRRNIPARPYLGISRANARELDEIIRDAWRDLR